MTIRYVLVAGLGAALGAGSVWAADPPIRPLALDAAEQYLELARYPESSRPIRVEEGDPILSKRLPTPQTLAGPKGADPRLTVWTSGVSFEPGQTVDLFAKLNLARAGKSLLRKPPLAQITAELIAETTGPLGKLVYADNGRDADRTANDGIYSARFVLPLDRAPVIGYAESIMVKVQARTAAGDVRHAVGGFQYSHPGAQLTGHFRDGVKEGSLVLSAEVEVLAPGRYHLSSTLANLGGEPLAYAQTAQRLQPGKHWLDLVFYGLIFRERAAAGPYRLASITVTSANEMPNALGPVLSNVYTTSAHALSAFTTKSFGNADLLDAARRLQRDANQSVAPKLR